MKWSYGITTVPSRLGNTFDRTLLSLAAAGFDAPRIFVDGCGSPCPYTALGFPVTARTGPPARTVTNWICTLWELYGREPNAARYAVFQDDFVTGRGLREYLERWYPARGYQNLYTFPSNQSLCTIPGEKPGTPGHGWFQSNQFGRGAVALVFDRAAVQALLGAKSLVEKPTCAHRGWRSVDGAILTALKAAGFREWVHSPSLVQHIGDVSSMGNKPHPAAPYFLGEDFDYRTLDTPSPE